MTSRNDCEYLPIGERFYLTLSAIDMIEEGLSAFTDELLSELEYEDVDVDVHEVHDIVGEMRTDAYRNLLHTMANDRDEAKALTKMLRLHQREQKD
jgi:hypothetical protein